MTTATQEILEIEIPHFESTKADREGIECYVFLSNDTATKVYRDDAEAAFKRAVEAAKQGIGPKILSYLLKCYITISHCEEFKEREAAFYYITERVTPGNERGRAMSYRKFTNTAREIWSKFFGNINDFGPKNCGITKEGKVVIIDFGSCST